MISIVILVLTILLAIAIVIGLYYLTVWVLGLLDIIVPDKILRVIFVIIGLALAIWILSGGARSLQLGRLTMPLEIRYAVSTKERDACAELVYRQYQALGYVPLSPSGMYTTIWQDLPSTRIVLAVRDGIILSTVTLAFDGPWGLPCELVFPKEVARARNLGQLAEITCLAGTSGAPKMILWLRNEALPDLCDMLIGCCNPTHLPFWQNWVGSVFPNPLDIRRAKHVGSAPAVFGYLTVETIAAALHRRL